MTENQEISKEELLKSAGIPDNDQFMGLIMSTESNGLDEDMMDQAFQDWRNYYGTNSTNFGWVLCHLISKADIYNLHRLSKGFPEHVRVFAENHIIASVSKDKIDEVMGDANNDQ